MSQQILVNTDWQAGTEFQVPTRAALLRADANFTELYAAIGSFPNNPDVSNATGILPVANGGTGTSTGLGASAISYLNTVSGLTSVEVQDAIDEIVNQRIAPHVLLSSQFNLVADNSTDNNTAILAWIAAANAIIGGSPNVSVKMVLTPGVYRTTGRHVFPGSSDVEFLSAQLIASGTDSTNPLFTHGSSAGVTSGKLTNIWLDSVVSHNYVNPNFIGLRLANKAYTFHELAYCRGFYTATQFQASNNFWCAYNRLSIGSNFACKKFVDFNSGSANSAFASENTITGGNCQPTSAMANFGSCFGMSFTQEYETGGYAGQSGNFWYNPSFQLLAPGTAWPVSTLLVAGRRYYTPKMGGEWLCSVGGISGTVEPTLLPVVVDVTNITLVATSATATMASTTGLAAGMQIRGTNPASAFTEDTYILSVDSSTQITLTNAASASSSNFHGSFITPTTDNAAKLIYIGPYRRSPAWMRNCGGQNGIRDARWETGSGEALIISGTHLYPEKITNTLGNFSGTFHEGPGTAINICNAPVWVAAHGYVVGDQCRPTVLGTVYWECIANGTSGGSEPTPTNSTAGSTFVDGCTWLIRPIRTTQSSGDWGEYVGGLNGNLGTWNHYIARTLPDTATTAMIDNWHLRACGSAAGWLVRDLVKSTNAGVITPNFAAGDLAICRDGLSILSTTTAIGAIFNAGQIKGLNIRKRFGSYSSCRFWMIPLDKNFQKLVVTTNQSAYHRRIQSALTISGANIYVDTTDTQSGNFYCLINEEVKYVFLGFQRGSTGTPVACTVEALAVTQAQNFSRTLDTLSAAQFMTTQGSNYAFRSSLGVPTLGFYNNPGEYIQNASVQVGQPKGFFVTTVGFGAAAWITSTVYKKGDMVSAGGNVYAANGNFTSGTTPSGTGQNFLDATATSILAGDVATWDYMGPTVAFTNDVNL